MSIPFAKSVNLELEQYERLQALAQSQEKNLTVILREVVALGLQTLQVLPNQKARRRQALAELLTIRAALSAKQQGGSDACLTDVRKERSAQIVLLKWASGSGKRCDSYFSIATEEI